MPRTRKARETSSQSGSGSSIDQVYQSQDYLGRVDVQDFYSHRSINDPRWIVFPITNDVVTLTSGHGENVNTADTMWSKMGTFYDELYPNLASAVLNTGKTISETDVASDTEKNWFGTVLRLAFNVRPLMHIINSRDQSIMATKISAQMVRSRAQIFHLADELAKLPIPPAFREVVDYWTQPITMGPNQPVFHSMVQNTSGSAEADYDFTQADHLAQWLAQAETDLNTVTSGSDVHKVLRALHLSHPDWFNRTWPALQVAVDEERVIAYLTQAARRDDPVGTVEEQQPNREDWAEDLIPVYYRNELRPLHTTPWRPTFAFEANDKDTDGDSFGMLKNSGGIDTNEETMLWFYDIEGDFGSSVADFDENGTKIFNEAIMVLHYAQAIATESATIPLLSGAVLRTGWKRHDLSVSNMGQNGLDFLIKAWFGDGLTVPMI